MARLDDTTPDNAISRDYRFTIWYSASWQNTPDTRGVILSFYDGGYFFQVFLGYITGNLKTRIWNGVWQNWK